MCLDEEHKLINTIYCDECLSHRKEYDNMVTEHETKFGNYSQGYCSICIDYCGGCISFDEYLSLNLDYCDNYRCITYSNSHDTISIITPTIYKKKYIIPFPMNYFNGELIIPSSIRGIIIIGYDIHNNQYYSYHNVNRYKVSKGQVLYWEGRIDIPIKHNRFSIEHSYIMDEFYKNYFTSFLLLYNR